MEENAVVPTEETAAQALILLFNSLSCPQSSSSFSSPSSSFFSCRKQFVYSKPESSSSISGSSSSVLTFQDFGGHEYGEIQTTPLDVLAIVACSHEMQPKFVRKCRSKRSSRSRISCQKSFSSCWRKAFSPPVTSEASIQSSCSRFSYGRGEPRRGRLKVKAGSEKMKWKGRYGAEFASPRLRRRADAILKFLSDGSTSEIRIREVLGNSPDISKALRIAAITICTQTVRHHQIADRSTADSRSQYCR